MMINALLFALYAAAVDPRLATVKTAYVVAFDDLGDDRPVAACFADHLSKQTPLTAADESSADVVVRIGAHLDGNTSRQLTGSLGTVRMTVTTPDGTKLWGGAAILNASDSLSRSKSFDIPCALADEMSDKLRQAMRKSRDSK